MKYSKTYISLDNSEISTIKYLLENYNFLDSEIGYDPETAQDVNTILQKISLLKT